METIEETSSLKDSVSRRSLLRLLGVGAAITAGSAILAGCGGGSSSSGGNSDQEILNAAATAEGLASTMYANIIS